ncbi:MAG: hypothetical protein V7785_24695 [Bermanella sp.]
MYAQVEKPKENKSRAVANSVGQKRSSVKQGFGFVDNRPEAIAQRKRQELAHNSSQVKQLRSFKKNRSTGLNRKDAVQLYNLGWVPSTPGTYRNMSNAIGSTVNTRGHAVFGNRRYQVENNNVANAGAGVGAVALPANHMVSDVGGIDLPTYAQASNISPECDHIVMDSEFGANDLENGRMISKAQNNNAATPRPHAPAFGGTFGAGANDVHLRLYTPIASINNATTGAVISGPIASGTPLTFLQTQALSTYANNYNPPAWANVNNAVLNGIQNVGAGTQNNITIV